MILRALFPAFLGMALFLFHIPCFANSVMEDSLIAKAKELHLAQDEQWKRLLLYKKISSAKDLEFELEETLRSFFSKDYPLNDEHPLCRFPARKKWLQQKLGIEEAAFFKTDCARYRHYLEMHNPQSVSVVFSSYYLNAPASSFGHTLLRFNKKRSHDDELLDMGVNFAANVTTSNPIIYAIKGLVGGFEGSLSSFPYFYKIREYNDFESRDLWSYELDLTQEELQRLLDHLWEQSYAKFDYVYLTKNCSYQVTALLDVAVPRAHLLDQLPFYIIPSETVKVLYTVPGFVTKVTYRPSSRKRFYAYHDVLSEQDKKIFKDFYKTQNFSFLNSTTISPQGKADIVDTAIEYTDFLYAKEILLTGGPVQKWKHELLYQRSLLESSRTPEQLIQTPTGQAPQLAHGPFRFSFFGGDAKQEGAFTGFELRFALHDLLDPPKGVPELSQVEFVKTRFRYNVESKKVWAEDIALIDIMMFNPMDEFSHHSSLHVKGGLKSFIDSSSSENSVDKLAPYGEFSFGPAINIGKRSPVTLGVLWENEIAYHPRFHRTHMFWSTGPGAYVLKRWNEKWITQIWDRYHWVPTESEKRKSSNEYGQETRFFLGENDHYGVSLKTMFVQYKHDFDREIRLGLLSYF